MPTLLCPSCGVKLRVPKSAFGQTKRCPKCRKRIRLNHPPTDALPALTLQEFEASTRPKRPEREPTVITKNQFLRQLPIRVPVCRYVVAFDPQAHDGVRNGDRPSLTP